MPSCSHCGAALRDGLACDACGHAPAATAPPATYAPAAAPGSPETRPLGVLLVAIGFFLLAFGAAMFGLFLLALGPAFGAVFDVIPFFGLPFGAAVAAFLVALGVMALGFAAVTALVAYGVLQGRSWAWAAALVIAALGALFSLLQVAEADFDGVLGVLAWGGVAYYFWRPETRAWFGRPA